MLVRKVKCEKVLVILNWRVVVSPFSVLCGSALDLQPFNLCICVCFFLPKTNGVYFQLCKCKIKALAVAAAASATAKGQLAN